MEFVKHKKFGTGEVIQIKDNILTVYFPSDASQRTFAIPQSFQMGFITAEGDLKVNIDKVIARLDEAKKANIKPKEEQQRDNLINCLYKSRTLVSAYGCIYKLLQYDTWSEEQIKNLFDATVGASYGLKTLEIDDIYTFYSELLKSEAGIKCHCESKYLIMEQLEYIDSDL